ncbi:MAG: hypothetical protein Q4F41_12575 [Eubacteriales bacterium]|nr:hypothetical protein [Eubacteriales bacterium]
MNTPLYYKRHTSQAQVVIRVHIQNNAVETGYPRLVTITKPMIQKILCRSEIKPFKIEYYCEKRDPDFESKMHGRINSKQELGERIYLYFDEVNQEPVRYHWTYKLDDISVSEAKEAGIKANENCYS